MRDDGGDALWATIVLVIGLAIVLVVFAKQCTRSAECEKRGGRFVEHANDPFSLGECVEPRRSK